MFSHMNCIFLTPQLCWNGFNTSVSVVTVFHCVNCVDDMCSYYFKWIAPHFFRHNIWYWAEPNFNANQSSICWRWSSDGYPHFMLSSVLVILMNHSTHSSLVLESDKSGSIFALLVKLSIRLFLIYPPNETWAVRCCLTLQIWWSIVMVHINGDKSFLIKGHSSLIHHWKLALVLLSVLTPPLDELE